MDKPEQLWFYIRIFLEETETRGTHNAIYRTLGALLDYLTCWVSICVNYSV